MWCGSIFSIGLRIFSCLWLPLVELANHPSLSEDHVGWHFIWIKWCLTCFWWTILSSCSSDGIGYPVWNPLAGSMILEVRHHIIKFYGPFFKCFGLPKWINIWISCDVRRHFLSDLSSWTSRAFPGQISYRFDTMTIEFEISRRDLSD